MKTDLKKTYLFDGNQLLFEKSKSGKKGFFLPERRFPEKKFADSVPSHFQRKESAEFPELTEPELIRHFVNL